MEAAEALVMELMDAITAGDEAELDQLLHPDLVSHGALGDVAGPDGFKNVMLTNVKRAFPDAEVRAEGVIADGAMVAWRVAGSGTHTGPFLGIEPTGRRIRIRGIHQGRIADGRLIEHWQGPDILAMLLDMDKLPH
jgi:predicted ester cyclase